jgi:heat shock factor-binding protein 1
LCCANRTFGICYSLATQLFGTVQKTARDQADFATGGIVAEESLPRQKERLNTMADQRLDLSADTVPDNAADLTLFVQNLLEQMQGRFNTMSSSIISRIDEMGNRIDDLEKSIGELMQQVRIVVGDAIALRK